MANFFVANILNLLKDYLFLFNTFKTFYNLVLEKLPEQFIMSKDSLYRRTILYAEDDEDDQQLIKDSFVEYASDVEIVILNNGVEAVSYLNNLSVADPKPCLIILDINMPRMNGLEALKQIKSNKRFANIPAILFTTSSQQEDKKLAAQYDASIITKPVDSKQMKVITEKFIKCCG